MQLHRIAKALADLIWVPECAACAAAIDPGMSTPLELAFCGTCADTAIPIGSPRCPRCALPFETGDTDHLCRDCLLEPPPFQETRSAFLYGGAISRALTRFKYQPCPRNHLPLGRLLAEATADGISASMVIPVPLHRQRLRQRGFNQSALLARAVCRKLGLPLVTSVLARPLGSPPHARMGRLERRALLKRSFVARRDPRLLGATVLLVDDVVTTTSTVRAAAAALLDAGCGCVNVVSLARAV